MRPPAKGGKKSGNVGFLNFRGWDRSTLKVESGPSINKFCRAITNMPFQVKESEKNNMRECELKEKRRVG